MNTLLPSAERTHYRLSARQSQNPETTVVQLGSLGPATSRRVTGSGAQGDRAGVLPHSQVAGVRVA